MLDPNLLRNELDVVAKKLARRNCKLDTDSLRHYEKERKALQIETENLQAQSNAHAKLIGAAKAKGEDIELLCEDTKQLGERLNVARAKLQEVQNKLLDVTLSLPNLPDDSVPEGNCEQDNKVISHWGDPRKDDCNVEDHITLGERRGELDFAAGVKLTGTRFVVMKGAIARLHRALSQFMLDLHTEQHGYQEVYVPYLVNSNSLLGTGQLPKFGEDLFHTKPLAEESSSSNYALIPTAEVPLTNLVRGEILEGASLPLKMTAHTPCFRSEAGSYGRDTRGLIRMHQFDKVELVQITRPENSMDALEELTKHAEKVLQLLKLPYRKVLLCTGDIGAAACKTYDLEVWLPAQKKYREISSCSNMGDFQARRMEARYRDKQGEKPQLVHTLNGSGLAVGRTLVAVLENNQQADGKITIPEVLRPYMRGLEYIG